jgi:hypothetical protein
MSKLSLTLLAVLALPAFAEGPAPKPAEGAPAPAPKSGAATTATPKGQGVKKVKPATTTPSTTGQKAAETGKAQ